MLAPLSVKFEEQFDTINRHTMAAAGANAAAATAASAAAVFTELCARFQLDDAVKDQIIATGVSTLSEFRHFVTQSSELEGAFITPIQGNLANARLQLARLRSCWSAVCTAETQREGRASSTPLQLDEDDLLPSAQLTNIRDVFWARYKLVFPSEFTPSDRLLTKAQRALQKRSLEVIDIMRVKSISTQRMSGEKRRKVANNLWVGEDPDEIPGGFGNGRGKWNRTCTHCSWKLHDKFVWLRARSIRCGAQVHVPSRIVVLPHGRRGPPWKVGAIGSSRTIRMGPQACKQPWHFGQHHLPCLPRSWQPLSSPTTHHDRICAWSCAWCWPRSCTLWRRKFRVGHCTEGWYDAVPSMAVGTLFQAAWASLPQWPASLCSGIWHGSRVR